LKYQVPTGVNSTPITEVPD